MDEQRRQVLEMLAQGKVTAEGAERLIDALEREQPQLHPKATSRPKYLRVLVSEDQTDGGEPTHVDLRVPLKLLRAGVRLASLIPPRALNQVNTKLQSNGVPVDLVELKPQDLDDLIDHLDELTVDVDDAGTQVRIFCE